MVAAKLGFVAPPGSSGGEEHPAPFSVVLAGGALAAPGSGAAGRFALTRLGQRLADRLAAELPAAVLEVPGGDDMAEGAARLGLARRRGAGGATR